MNKLNDIYMDMKILIITVIAIMATMTAAFADGNLSDPMSIGVGARALGMGRAYVGMAEDGDAIFMNPAGLARITNPKLSSMYANLLGDVNYTVIGGAYPYGEKSAIGAGLINSSVADIPLTDATGASLGTGRWGNNVMFLSYGTYLSEVPGLNLKLGRDVLLGGSLKYFSVGGDGTGVTGAAGSGLDLDLGALVPVTNYALIGVNFQNALPSSLGAKITKSTGNDGIPAIVKAGAKFTLIGKEGDALSAHSSRKLYGNIDYDYHVNSSRPGVLHAGVEFWPTNNLALRAGMDDKDLTAGVGVRFSGIEFNYAYHPYSGINENTTQYFSIGYLGETRKRELLVKIDNSDKAVVYDDHVTIKGKVEIIEGNEEPAAVGPLSVKINGVNVALAPGNTFAADVALENYGKKIIKVEAADPAGASASQELRLVRLTSFADVPDGYWAKQPIENNATVGLVKGYPDQTFRPENALTRAELAALLVRAKGIKVPAGKAKSAFKDVKPDFWAAKYIEIARKEGLVTGYDDKTFRPNNKINKVEGIVVMTRFDGLKLTAVDAKPYWDISENHWGARYIQAAKEAGMLKFVERNKLRPRETLARSEAVEMLSRTALAGGKIKDLFTWEKGITPESAPQQQRPQIKASLY